MLGEVTKLLYVPLALAAMVNSPAAFMQMAMNTLLSLSGSRLTSTLNAHFFLRGLFFFFFLACMCFSPSLYSLPFLYYWVTCLLQGPWGNLRGLRAHLSPFLEVQLRPW